MNKFSRLGSALSVFGASRFDSFSTFDFVHLGSSLALRSFGRMGSGLSIYDFLHIGSTLSLRSIARTGSSLSFLGLARFFLPLAGNLLQLHLFTEACLLRELRIYKIVLRCFLD